MYTSQSRRRRDFHDLFECNQGVQWPADGDLSVPAAHDQILSPEQLPLSPSKSASGRPKTCPGSVSAFSPPGTPQQQKKRPPTSGAVQSSGSGTLRSRATTASAVLRNKRISGSDSMESRGLWHTPMSPTAKMLAASNWRRCDEHSLAADDAMAWFSPMSPPSRRSEPLKNALGLSLGTSKPSHSPRRVVPKALTLQDLPPHVTSHVVKLLSPGSMAALLLASRRAFSAALDLAVTMTIQEVHRKHASARNRLAPMRLSAPNMVQFLERLGEAMACTQHQVVAAGPRHSLILNLGMVFGFGSAACGQLGLGYPAHEVRLPRPVALMAPVTLVACGGDHSIALTADGKAWAFGHNAEGQLGTGNIGDDASGPVPVCLPDTELVQAACGTGHSLFLSSSGVVWGCGRGAEGQLGLRSLANEKPENVSIPLPRKVEDIEGSGVCLLVCGSDSSLAINHWGQLLVFGANSSGQLGIGNREVQWRPVPVRLPGATLAIQASCGGSHTLVVGHDGRVYGAGGNSHGQLGLKDASDRVSFTVAVRRREVGGSAIRSVSCGFAHSLLLTRAGAVWGLGDCALPGPEGANPREAQTLVSSMRILGGSSMRIEGMAAGGGHSLCWAADGTFLSFGGGAGGQLGCGDDAESGEEYHGPRKIIIADATST